MKNITEREKKLLDIVIGVAMFAVVIYVGYFSLIAQTESNSAWMNDCNEKYGVGNWETRSGTWEERCTISHHIGPVAIPYIGQISVCVAKEK